jgi:hydroxymethylbilane synthase
MTRSPILRLGTRGSPLALAQSEEVCRRLCERHPELDEAGALETVVIKTTGDKVRDRTLAAIGGKGLFTKEIEEALLERAIDLAVHSMKDVPTWLPEGLGIGAILPREDPRDALFAQEARSLAELPAGAVVGTASLRRQAQVLAARPDLTVVPLRGNVGTRLRKLSEGQVDATLLAVAGLRRLGQSQLIRAPLAPEEILPAVAQGAIGLEVRREDSRTLDWLARLDHGPSHRRISAERACLEVLDGSCRTPIAVLAELDEEGVELRLRALVALPDGSCVNRTELSGPIEDGEALGREAGRRLRARAGTDFFAALAVP